MHAKATQERMRIVEVDTLRGIAIVMMVIYHILFDINYFGIMQIKLDALPIVLFQRIIGAMFLSLVGVSLALSESHNAEGYKRHLLRGVKLACVALLITIVTWIYPHEDFITFGIIHMIALSTFIAPFFFRFGRLNYILGLFVIATGLVTSTIVSSVQFLFWLGIVYPGYSALDYYPVLPWFGVVLIGIGLGHFFIHKQVKFSSSVITRKLADLGRNSLIIYLAHQPIIIAIILLIRTFG